MLKDAWENEARRWAEWARRPGHDSYWQFHRDQFLELLPAPGALTVDFGCGEGRLSRDLQRLGHRTRSFDASPTLVQLAREADPQGDYQVADAAQCPFPDGCADLVVAFMTLHDIDDLDAAVRHAARLLSPGGKLCAALVHPLNSAGRFSGTEPDSPFVIAGSYLDEFPYSDSLSRDGLDMTFHSLHRPLEAYSRALEAAGLAIEALREHRVPDQAALQGSSQRWQRLPLFLHFRAGRLW